jgi:hypothetical protein
LRRRPRPELGCGPKERKKERNKKTNKPTKAYLLTS